MPRFDSKLTLLTRMISFTAFFHLTSSLLNDPNLDNIVTKAVFECDHKAAFGIAVVAQNRNSSGIDNNFNFVKAYGYQNISAKKLANSQTLFCIGSLTKHITATLVLHLLHELRLRGSSYSMTTLLTELDTDLDFPNSELRNTTLEDVLSHRTGIAEVFGPFWVGYPKNTSRKNLARITATLPRLWPNRERYGYNNHVFSIAGYMAEILGKILFKEEISWEALVDRIFLTPLGIKNDTDFAGHNFAHYDRLAVPYVTDYGTYRELDHQVQELIEPAGPAGSICLSSSAMIIWMQFLVNRGQHARRQIVDPSVIEETWKPRIMLPVRNSSTGAAILRNQSAAYALGWITSNYRGFKSLEHSGGFYSYMSLCTIYPDLNISIFTSSSGPYTSNVRKLLWRLHFNIFERLSGLSQTATKSCENSLSRTTENSPDLLVDPDHYTGSFSHPVHGLLKVILTDQLVLMLQVGRFGNATLRCVTSQTVCNLQFHGILWWISDSDAFRNERGPNRTVIFNTTCAGFVTDVILPLYCDEDPPVFSRVSEHPTRKIISLPNTCLTNIALSISPGFSWKRLSSDSTLVMLFLLQRFWL